MNKPKFVKMTKKTENYEVITELNKRMIFPQYGNSEKELKDVTHFICSKCRLVTILTYKKCTCVCSKFN